ncbi:hypothetical protein FNF29_02215 [Cafeteria roenbergensis]|uniref:Uncharacterized protein n=1 Tax=Cafeteria roenbergensis TaxID=33653 RepID=A0A5A8D1J9_CAFRO|nr:hypothetical protein FNF31_07264 [Cafeteria roenbergensis]KAA0154686.1 hypothetical protein FNF29_02215 [Cafeteria roenbergensis]KAA0158829.1 hypothetical protein FNF28_06074 [Cafeteria roenbergensis]|eukprot:KAA0154686.1 hypothetical protein FNF29_02215 [Cafeteria roenbergensis]
MASATPARITKELAALASDGGAAGVSAAPRGDDMRTLDCTIKGPEDTPYEAGVFKLLCEIPDDYPFVPPKLKFMTKVWHPNISSQTGAICLDILKDAWTPAMTLISLLLSVRALLAAAEPTDPQDAQVARQYLSDRRAFDATAKAWADAYATADGAAGAPPAAPIDARVTQLMEMGFAQDQAEAALASAGNVGGAVAMLLSG